MWCFAVKTKGGKPKYEPLRATYIHQIWHADITVFKTLDNTRHYIYTVMDNYSRKILTWRVELFVSAQVRVETLRKAMIDFPTHTVRLITDGGPENDNRTIKSFIDQSQTDINHQIALRDIVQSNSMVEASYKTLKYRCLYRKEIAHGDQLKKVLTDFFYEYNHVRPHYALGIYTPDEVEQGADLKLKNQSPLLAEAAIEMYPYEELHYPYFFPNYTNYRCVTVVSIFLPILFLAKLNTFYGLVNM